MYLSSIFLIIKAKYLKGNFKKFLYQNEFNKNFFDSSIEFIREKVVSNEDVQLDN